MKTYPFLLLLFASTLAYAQSGTIDRSFNPSDIGFGAGDGANGGVFSIAMQPDNKILLGGGFTSFNGTTANYIIRLNPDGRVDSTFNTGTGANTIILSIVLQSDGKILLGGNFATFNGRSVNRIVRLNPDGSIDGTFNTGTGANGTVESILLQADGQILLGGNFTTFNGITVNRIIRLNQDGSIDDTFNIGTGLNGIIKSMALQADGKILLGGGFTSFNGFGANRIVRLNSDGGIDETFKMGTGANNIVESMAIQEDGKILLVGGFTSFNDTSFKLIIRLTSDGSIDETFNFETEVYNFSIVSISLQVDGKILLSGGFNGTGTNPIVRLNTDGSLDDTFNTGTGANIGDHSVALQVDGKILVGGNFTFFNGTRSNCIVRLTSDGSIDGTFNTVTGVNNYVYTIVLQTDEKILLGGDFTSYNGKTVNRIVRLNIDGSIDETFNTGTGVNSSVLSIILQSDGKILLGGGFTSFNGTNVNRIVRLNTDGSIDETFNTGTGASGPVQSITLQTDGKILLGGYFTSFNGTIVNRIVRLNPNGSIDGTFSTGTGANNDVLSIVLQAEGKILLGGSFDTFNGTNARSIVRLNPDGSIDGTFNTGTGVNNIVRSVTLQADEKILLGGSFTSFNGTIVNRIIRLNTDGTSDGTFKTGTGLNNPVQSIVMQSDGKILIGGSFNSYNGTSVNRIVRLNSDGTLDDTFNTGTGANNFVRCIALQSDRKILLGGFFTSFNGTGRNRIARLLNPLEQTITFEPVSDKVFGEAPFIVLTSSSSTLPVSVISLSPNKATVSGFTVTLTGAGRVTLEASQSGDDNYAATAVQQSFCVRPVQPTITSSADATPLLTSSNTLGNQWYRDGNAIPGAVEQTLLASLSGVYKVLTRVDDCLSDFSEEVAVLVTGLTEKNDSFVLFPNPTKDYVMLTGLSEESQLQVISILGVSQHFTYEKEEDKHMVNVAHLVPGLYILQINDRGTLKQIRFKKE